MTPLLAWVGAIALGLAACAAVEIVERRREVARLKREMRACVEAARVVGETTGRMLRLVRMEGTNEDS